MAWQRVVTQHRCAPVRRERGRHAVYLQSAVQRLERTLKTALSLLSQIPRGQRLCDVRLVLTALRAPPVAVRKL
eukprot:6320933-Prymnesium_polylepis.1